MLPSCDVLATLCQSLEFCFGRPLSSGERPVLSPAKDLWISVPLNNAVEHVRVHPAVPAKVSVKIAPDDPLIGDDMGRWC